MKKNVFVYIFIAIIIVVASIFVVKHFSNTTLSVKDTDFAIKDTARIAQVTLTDKKGHILKLARTSNGWMVNNHLTAANYMITQLLTTFYNMAVKYPVMAPAYQHVVKDMAGTAIEVEVTDVYNKPIKTLYIGGPDLTSTGTFTKMAGSDNIFATYIPGFEGYLTTRFSAFESDWRDKHLFNLSPSDIKQIVVAYPTHPDSSFQLNVYSPDSFIIYNYNQQIVSAIKQKIVLYLQTIVRLQSEAIINESLAKDTTVLQKPFCVVTLTAADNKTYKATFFRKGITRSTQLQVDPKTDKPYSYDLERALALTNNNKDFVLVQYATINRMLRPLQYFTGRGK